MTLVRNGHLYWISRLRRWFTARELLSLQTFPVTDELMRCMQNCSDTTRPRPLCSFNQGRTVLGFRPRSRVKMAQQCGNAMNTAVVGAVLLWLLSFSRPVDKVPRVLSFKSTALPSPGSPCLSGRDHTVPVSVNAFVGALPIQYSSVEPTLLLPPSSCLLSGVLSLRKRSRATSSVSSSEPSQSFSLYSCNESSSKSSASATESQDHHVLVDVDDSSRLASPVVQPLMDCLSDVPEFELLNSIMRLHKRRRLA